MIKDGQSDTAEPHNLLDDDFDKDMVNLPPPRPSTDLTPMVCVVTKNRISSVFGMIADLTASIRPSSYAEVMKLDKILHETRLAIPPGLQLRPMTQSITDYPDVVMRRIYLALMFHKAQCILHRKYLIPARTNRQYVCSRRSCITAALQILQHQSTLNQETQPGGQLYRDRWKVSSLVNHDFLLAATILCLDLDHTIGAGPSSQHNEDAIVEEGADHVAPALHESYKIWLKSSTSSREAQKATEVLKIMLGKFKGFTMRGNTVNRYENSVSPFVNNDLPVSITGKPECGQIYPYLLTSIELASDSVLTINSHFHYPSSFATHTNEQALTPVQYNTPIPSSKGFGDTSIFADMVDGFDWVRRFLGRFLPSAKANLALGYIGFPKPGAKFRGIL